MCKRLRTTTSSKEGVSATSSTDCKFSAINYKKDRHHIIIRTSALRVQPLLTTYYIVHIHGKKSLQVRRKRKNACHHQLEETKNIFKKHLMKRKLKRQGGGREVERGRKRGREGHLAKPFVILTGKQF